MQATLTENLEKRIRAEGKDRVVLKKLAAKMAAAERDPVNPRYRQEQILRFLQCHRKRFERLGVRLDDIFEVDAPRETLPEPGRGSLFGVIEGFRKLARAARSGISRLLGKRND